LPASASPEGSAADRESQSHDIGRVARNSFFLTAQPLLMNVVSLLAVAYIARTLGVADFGIFNLVTTYAMLFYPVAQAGMNRVMVRDMASLDDKAGYAARMVPVRVFVTGVAAIAIVLTAIVAGYDSRTTLAIIAGSSIFVGQMLAEIVADVFLASERTHFTAIAQFVAGLTLTILSVAVLYAGFGLFAMIAVYALGQFLGLALSLYLLHTKFFRLRWRADLRFAASKLVEGLPFFASVMMWTLFNRIDTVMLSKWGTTTELGLYTAPMLLVARLGVVPQGVSTALLPAISRLWNSGETRQVADLVRRVSDTLLVLALPAVVLVGTFSGAITSLLFGPAYTGSAIVLAIGIWIVLLRCVGAVQFSVLAGCNREKYVMRAYAVVTVYCVVSVWLLVRSYGMIGAAFGSLSTQVLLTVLLGWFSPVRRVFHAGVALRTVCVSAAMLVTAYATRGWNPWMSMGLVASLAAAGTFALGLVRPDQLWWLGRTFRRA
jgi:O-antigen/teichoic acid export membrane protein